MALFDRIQPHEPNIPPSDVEIAPGAVALVVRRARSLSAAREVPVPELDASVFIVPGTLVKNRQERLIVLNRVARSVIDEVRGMHP
ncbi:MAG: hypothetical protein OES46_20405 [Gammaproteobacteria bacterium]|nr:hypothetical protein [Gammaproteobacteria bacterium]